MNPLDQIARRLVWRPAACVASLADLTASHGLISKADVTAEVGAPNRNYPLLVVELLNGKIIGDLRLVATANDVAIGEVQNLLGCQEPEKHYLLRRRRFRMARYRRGTALLLGAAASDNYYHWLLDSLPRWKMLQAAGWTNYDWVLLPGTLTRFQQDTLERLDIPSSTWLRCSKNFVHQFERLIVPAIPYPVEKVPSWVCRWSRSLFPDKTSGPEKIYLRRGEARRKLLNEPELETALLAQGFVVIQPDTLTIAEQAKLLSSARCVVAPHGAALTNLIFAPPGAVLVELFHPQHKNSSFVNLAASCGHRYFSVDGCAVHPGNQRQLEYSVDVSVVLEILRATS